MTAAFDPELTENELEQAMSESIIKPVDDDSAGTKESRSSREGGESVCGGDPNGQESGGQAGDSSMPEVGGRS